MNIRKIFRKGEPEKYMLIPGIMRQAACNHKWVGRVRKVKTDGAVRFAIQCKHCSAWWSLPTKAEAEAQLRK